MKVPKEADNGILTDNGTFHFKLSLKPQDLLLSYLAECLYLSFLM